MLYNVLLIAQILIALSIIGLVLIQHGKGADAGAAFGGGASGTVFGSRGSGNFLSRTTAILAALFFANSLLLAWMTAHPTGVVNDSVIPAAVTESAAPATSAPAKKAPVNTMPADVPQADVPAAAPVEAKAADEANEANKAAKETKETKETKDAKAADAKKPADVPE